MTVSFAQCDRCGFSLNKHYHPQSRQWVGCPVPPGEPLPKGPCGFQGCESEQDDPVLGLCPYHQQLAAGVTQSRPRTPSQ